jgi:hypothetical protein
MVGKIIGALIGREVERRRQESGLKGAVIGAAAVGLSKRIVPLTLAAVGLYAAKRYLDGQDAATSA